MFRIFGELLYEFEDYITTSLFFLSIFVTIFETNVCNE